jgi:hypothetical protein
VAAASTLAVLLASSVGAQDPDPTPTPTPTPPPGEELSALAPWPSGDRLRRDLQVIGFTFRIDEEDGDWVGWAPLADGSEGPALRLDSAGTDPAVATFELELIGADAGPALTAYMEMASRLPLHPADSERTRRFILDDLLVAPPELLESCYLTDWKRGVAVVTVDSEIQTARIQVAESQGALEAADLDGAACMPLMPTEVAARLGDPSTERLTIGLGGDAAGFDPAEVTVEGALVTLVLTFRNDSAAEQTLTFESPPGTSTGPVAPGGMKLIVVRQLEPGDYPFFSESNPVELRGSVSVATPTDE